MYYFCTILFVCLVGWFVLVNYWVISRAGPKTERLTILRAATHETELGNHDLCLSRSHYTDTDTTSRERAATAGIEPGTPTRSRDFYTKASTNFSTWINNLIYSYFLIYDVYILSLITLHSFLCKALRAW